MTKHANEIDYRTVLLTLDGKVRGSRARRLGDELEAMYQDGYDQVILDLRACLSLDSLGTLSLEAALERGQRLFVIRSEDLLPEDLTGHARMRVFTDAGEAVRVARSQDESGIVAA